MKHHYIPCFYLKRWARADGTVREYRRLGHPPGKIAGRWQYPAGTGYEKNLYRINGLPDHLAHEVEKEFMQVLDNHACVINEAIERSIGDLDIHLDDGRAWARFVSSLRVRNPEAVAYISQGISEIQETTEREFETNYNTWRMPHHPATYEEYAATIPPHLRSQAAMDFLKRLIADDAVSGAIVRMIWKVIRVDPNSRYTLLTSDRPVMLPNGLRYRDSYIAIPLGPRSLFVAANDPMQIDLIRRISGNEIIGQMNNYVVRQARQYVWGIGDTETRYVANRIRTWPEPTMVRRDIVQNIIRETPIPRLDAEDKSASVSWTGGNSLDTRPSRVPTSESASP